MLRAGESPRVKTETAASLKLSFKYSPQLANRARIEILVNIALMSDNGYSSRTEGLETFVHCLVFTPMRVLMEIHRFFVVS